VSYNAYIRLLLAKGVEKEILQAASERALDWL